MNTSSIYTNTDSCLTCVFCTKSLGVPDNFWYPDFLDQANGCINNGFEPGYMKENEDSYLFSSKSECCDHWFFFDPYCATSSSTKEKFYPDQSSGLCNKKAEKEFESWERDRFETLEECCSDKFSTYNYDACCSAAGLGGCTPTGVVKYVPDWNTSSCLAKSETSLTAWENTVESDSASECCSEYFGFAEKQCCKDSGGCD